MIVLRRYLARERHSHGVSVDPIDHVAEVDQDICAEQPFPEIHWSPHLCQQFDEKRGPSKAEDGIHQTVDIVGNTQSGWCWGRNDDRSRMVDVKVGVCGSIDLVVGG